MRLPFRHTGTEAVTNDNRSNQPLPQKGATGRESGRTSLLCQSQNVAVCKGPIGAQHAMTPSLNQLAKSEMRPISSAPPVAPKNPDDDHDREDYAREEHEVLKNLRNVHNYGDIDTSAPEKGEPELLLPIDGVLKALLSNLVRPLENDVARVRIDDGK